jgi:Zn-dependent peptidase ImmA (M78 family)
MQAFLFFVHFRIILYSTKRYIALVNKNICLYNLPEVVKLHYTFTPLESCIENLYKHLSICNPEELNMINIAAKLNVWLHFADVPSTAIDRGGLYSLIIDRRLSKEQQWEDFGHELGHILRHAGNQMMLPDSMVQLQEAQAKNFALQFCVPTFMLLRLPFPATKREFIAEICSTFNVTEAFAKRRLEHFERQVYSHRFTQYLDRVMEKQKVYQ